LWPTVSDKSFKDSSARFHMLISDERNAALNGIISFCRIGMVLSGAPGASKSSVKALLATKE
jgi:hypothetical protein